MQYPALFMVDGDYVHVNCYQNTTTDDSYGGGAGQKDYIQEAKDYFRHKLLQYGVGTEVPIKSLLGHRSQASPQVRHISGQHIKEFTDFLVKHTDTFRVVDDHVLLVDYEGAIDIPMSERLHLPQPSIDVKLTQQMLDFFAQVIELKGPILVDQLYHLVTTNFPQELWFRIFKTPNDLTTFLKLFSDCFHVQANLVTLLQKPKINENHIQHAQKILYKNTLNRSSSPNTPNVSSASLVSLGQPVIGEFKLSEPVSNMVNSTAKSGGFDSMNNQKANSNADLQSIPFHQSFHDIKLENLCPSNCPSPASVALQNNPPGPQSASAQQPLPVVQPQNDRRSQSLKQRINSLVIKTLAENLEKDKQSMSSIQYAANGNVSSSSNSSSTATSPIHSNNYFIGDTWKIKILQNTRVISTIKESMFVTDCIAKLATPANQAIISFDCEGINLGAKGRLTLVEIGTTRGEAFIFDLLACPDMVQDGGLRALLENENVIKIIHDCRNDSMNLYIQFNILLKNVFDTQVSFFNRFLFWKNSEKLEKNYNFFLKSSKNEKNA